ncbi:MAG TPA: cytochrome c3 family protein [Burkholderiaceae bacterium]|nr:cytochrome c3 family protein [Burkholderiaceae bacterium]
MLLGPLALVAPLRAQTIESVLRPGDLIQNHAKWEEDCSKCHVRFERAAQDRLCMDCHKEVGRDMRERTGYHGQQKTQQPCRACHTDHKGRAARIVVLDKQTFDHEETDYPLRGKHRQALCEKCHEASKKYWDAPSQCVSCHRKDDVHKGSLGAKCADCHTENDWKEKAKFDHDKTRFPLKGKHVDAQCTDCHKKGVEYKEAPRACIGCHKKDDDGPKGHKGRYGEKCESCHVEKAWKPLVFNHDTATRFSLRGKHRTTKCNDCHTGNLYKDKTGSNCIDCHKKDDDGPKGHRGSLGTDCAACHVETGWKDKGKFDHDRTSFPLLGKHNGVKCADCHKSTNYKDVPKDCYSCHKLDDKHEGNLGTQCKDCHVEKDWKSTTRFDHDRTRFKLRNAHAAKKVQCRDCHVDLKHYRNTPMDCYSCHKKDDKHDGQQGTRCATCHNDRDWKHALFDHGLTRFPLLGKHAKVECKDCHKSPRFKDAKIACVSCHLKDDKHKKTLGSLCEDCHNPRDWKAWDFDHDKRTQYPLEGKHKGVACSACHTQPIEGKVKASTRCYACHAKNDVHDGTYGRQCEQCHVTSSFKTIRSRSAPRPSSALDVLPRDGTGTQPGGTWLLQGTALQRLAGGAG